MIAPSSPRTRRRAPIAAALGLAFTVTAGAEAPDWQLHEARYLRNIRQVTTIDMGLDKAGEPYFSPDGRQIIFQAVPKGQEEYQIYTINIDGSNLQMVSTGTGACTCAYFHPTARKILFASTHLDHDIADPANAALKAGYQRETGTYVWRFHPAMDIFEANPDGSSLHRLTDAPGYDAEGAWGRDGKEIAFSSNRTGDMEIYVMNADGSNVRRVTHRPGYDGGPFLSPDGKRIVYRGDPRSDNQLQLFVVDVDGRNDTQLTDNDAVNWAPYWHPNGRTIVYTTSRQGHHNYELYLMDIPTRKEQRLTFWPGNDRTNGFDGLGTFSWDGKQIVWTSKRGPCATSQVFVADFVMPDDFTALK